MRPCLLLVFLILPVSVPAQAAETAPASRMPARAPAPLGELQRDLVNLRFGMFIHFSPTTYLDVPAQLMPDHAPPRQGKDGVAGTDDDLSPALLAPARLDCGQWADAALSAGMAFGVLTTKHHDGFCLWPSRYSTYTVAQGCERDVVREFVDAFRQRGLKVGLYYSIRDRTERIAGDAAHGGISPEKIALIKNQLTELLTNYGEILYLVFDGWGNDWHESPTFSDISYGEIYRHIKSLQPACLILNHSRVRSVGDIPQIELSAGMELPEGADWPAVGGTTLQKTWFWRPAYATAPLRSVDWVVRDRLVPYNARNVVFQLNCAPNRDGLLDDNVVTRLAEIGRAWTRPPPLQTLPASWADWPVPSAEPRFAGENLARGKPVRLSPRQPAPSIAAAFHAVDGDPNTSVDLAADDSWMEIDLGEVRRLAGIRIWNRSPARNVLVEQGFVFVSAQPFASDDPALIQRQSGVETIVISEPSGYPTPYAVAGAGRYLRLVSTSGRAAGLGEIEVFALEQD